MCPIFTRSRDRKCDRDRELSFNFLYLLGSPVFLQRDEISRENAAGNGFPATIITITLSMFSFSPALSQFGVSSSAVPR